MKKIFAISILFYCCLAQAASAKSAGDALTRFHNANIAYQKLDYGESIRLYEELLKEDFVAPGIYYNLGNAFFKNGNFAKAIVNYERALKLDPDDEDANFNLKIASLKSVDRIESVPEIFYKRWTNNLATALPTGSWTVLLIAITWLVFAAAALYVLGRSVPVRKLAFSFLLVFLFLTICISIITTRSFSISYLDEKAVVMAPSVYVKSSPDEKGNDLFILHEGTKVEILDRLNDWEKIRIANGSVGWMKADEMEKI
jgi:tetratricopeptide (TPR) repeat protein